MPAYRQRVREFYQRQNAEQKERRIANNLRILREAMTHVGKSEEEIAALERELEERERGGKT